MSIGDRGVTPYIAFCTPINRYGISLAMPEKTSAPPPSLIRDLAAHRTTLKDHPHWRFVDLAKMMPDVPLDIRYASSDNFTGRVLYPNATALLRQAAADALAAARQALRQQGLDLLIYDAYRPYSVTLMLWEQLQDERYVAAPWTGSRHNRGCAVDVTLIDAASGEPLAMPTAYDEFSERAHQTYHALPAEVLAHRACLRRVMQRHGFEPLPSEWWHFDLRGWQEYPLLDLPFADLQNDGVFV